jgi:hypothetical protein
MSGAKQAQYQRDYRRSRAERLLIGRVLVDEGRLVAWDEPNLDAIDRAIHRLALE